MKVLREDVKKAAGGLQLCAGQEAGVEAAIHAMHNVFDSAETDAVLLVDAENAFNSINRNALLHNTQYICPPIHIFVYNCYVIPARLFIIGGKEIKSCEGTTQGDPTAMATYALALVPLLQHLMESDPDYKPKMVAFADDLTGAGNLLQLHTWWNRLLNMGPKYGYFPKPSKSYLIVKDEKYEEACEIFAGSRINITTSGQRHLGAVIGSMEFKDEYVNNLVARWTSEMQVLSKIAEIQPQAAYAAYTHGFKSKFNYSLRTINNISAHMKPIEEVIRNEFIPAITGGVICSDLERKMLSFPTKLGGLGIDIVHEISDYEYEASRKVTQRLIKKVIDQDMNVEENNLEVKMTKTEINKERQERRQNNLSVLKESMSDKQRRVNEILQEHGSSNWLNVLPIEELNYSLSKNEFWDAVRLRYEWPIPNMPNLCSCSEKFNVQHAMSCKKGGFITMRHNDLRDMTADLLSEVCKDVEVEPVLHKLTGEEFKRKSVKREDESRLDISVKGFWVKGQKNFVDIRVFDPSAVRYKNQSIKRSYVSNEMEKKRHYNDRVLQVEHGSFSPLVFTVNGGMGNECKAFYSRLAGLLSTKRRLEKSTVVSWLRTKISFALLRSAIMCIRGSRSTRKTEQRLDDIELAENISKI